MGKKRSSAISSSYRLNLSKAGAPKNAQKESRREASKNRRVQQRQLEKDFEELNRLQKTVSFGDVLRASVETPSAIIEATPMVKNISEDEELDNMLSECAARPKIYIATSRSINTQEIGYKYEIYVKKYFEQLGYTVESTPLVHDYGVDLLCIKGCKTIAIQCKYWSEFAGVSSVQEVYAGCNFYDANKSIVITNNGFTNNAMILANKIGVELMLLDFSLRVK